MDTLRVNTIKELRQARADLLGVRKEQLNIQFIRAWYKKWAGSFLRADSMRQNIEINILPHYCRGFDDSVTDPDAWDDLRNRIIKLLENAVTNLDKKEVVTPVIDTLIAKVADIELATFLKEFNSIKDAQPNIAAIGFRTILSIILKIRARRVASESDLAVREDISFDRDLSDAIKEGIFPEAEIKLLKRYQDGGNKVVFDNIVHKIGESSLIDKDKLSDAVDNLLNKLLPHIIE